MADGFKFDVFLSHSRRDKSVVRLISSQTACLSADAFRSDWIRLEMVYRGRNKSRAGSND